MDEQIPSIGRIVHYRLTADDATQINRRRTTGKSIADRMKLTTPGFVSLPEGEGPGVQMASSNIHAWPAGAQAHIGNDVGEGDTFPNADRPGVGTFRHECGEWTGVPRRKRCILGDLQDGGRSTRYV